MRGLRISIRLNVEEYDELVKRAKKEHLQMSTYCRWFLFNSGFFIQKGESIERISRGVPRRIVSQEVTDILKSSPVRTEVIREMKDLFSKGKLKTMLTPVTDEMKAEVYENRLKDEFQPLLKLHPPK